MRDAQCRNTSDECAFFILPLENGITWSLFCVKFVYSAFAVKMLLETTIGLCNVNKVCRLHLNLPSFNDITVSVWVTLRDKPIFVTPNQTSAVSEVATRGRCWTAPQWGVRVALFYYCVQHNGFVSETTSVALEKWMYQPTVGSSVGAHSDEQKIF